MCIIFLGINATGHIIIAIFQCHILKEVILHFHNQQGTTFKPGIYYSQKLLGKS